MENKVEEQILEFNKASPCNIYGPINSGSLLVLGDFRKPIVFFWFQDLAQNFTGEMRY